MRDGDGAALVGPATMGQYVVAVIEAPNDEMLAQVVLAQAALVACRSTETMRAFI